MLSLICKQNKSTKHFSSIDHLQELEYPEGGVTEVNFCWICAAGLSELLPYHSVF